MSEQETGQRQRVAAILAADVVAYSRLMADNETATIAALDAARAVFTEHIQANQGRVVDTAGDSVLSVFETTAGAVEAAMAVQAALGAADAEVPEARRMRFRIGVHLGDIHEKTDGTIYGDGVNIAARLEGLAEPGSVAVSDAVHATIRGRVSFDFADLGEHKVKNIEHPVRAFRVLAEGEAAPVTRKWPNHWGPAALLLVAVTLVISIVAFWPDMEAAPPPEPARQETEEGLPPIPSGPSIAVLPFDNLGGDPEQEYFADGLAEDILTRLAAFPDLKVIARNSSFQYKGEAVDVREVGRNLGAGFVLEGSVRRDATSIRVSAQLLDADDGAHVWQQTYDRDLSAAGIFAIQDEISGQVVAALGGPEGAIVGSEIRRLQKFPTNNLHSYECVLLAKQYAVLSTPTSHLAARDCLLEVVASDPNYVEALVWLGQIYLEEIWSGFNPREVGPSPLDGAFEVLTRAVQLDPKHQQARRGLAWAYYSQGDIEQFYDDARKAVAINPNEVQTLAEIAKWMGYGGKWVESRALTERLRSLVADVPVWHHFTEFNYHYRERNFAAAATSARAAQTIEHWAAPWYLALAYAGMGEDEKALEALAKARAIEPNLTTETVRGLADALFLDTDHIALLMAGHAGLLALEEAQATQRPVIAVLPFDNLSGDAEQDYFVDGLTEDIIAALSRFQHLAVIARNSAFRYKGQTIDVRAIGAELGARYVVEGSIRRGGDIIRIIARLIDVESETQIWSETFERALTPENIFAIQDEVTARIASTIGDTQGVIGIASMDDMRRGSPTSLASYDCVLRATEYMRIFADALRQPARECLENTVRADPDYALAWSWLAEIYLDEYRRGLDPGPDLVTQALAAANKAVQLAPNDGRAYFAQANAFYYDDNLEAFSHAAERALELNPYSADTLIHLGHRFAYAGQWEKGLALVDKAIAIQPFHPLGAGFAPYFFHYHNGDYDLALETALKMNLPDYVWALGALAAAYGQLGRTDDAAPVVARMLELRPDIAQTARADRAKFFRYQPDLLDHFMDGLRKAGLNIPDAPSG
jgi:adenylate cyclase